MKEVSEDASVQSSIFNSVSTTSKTPRATLREEKENVFQHMFIEKTTIVSQHLWHLQTPQKRILVFF